MTTIECEDLQRRIKSIVERLQKAKSPKVDFIDNNLEAMKKEADALVRHEIVSALNESNALETLIKRIKA